MSRSFGVTSLTTRPPIDTVPSEMLLEPSDHAQRGRLAAPGRPDEHEELAVVDVERQVEDGLDAVVVDLVDFVERDVSHGSPNPPDVERGAVGGEDAVASVFAVERLELGGTGSSIGVCAARDARHEQLLVARLAHEGDRVGGRRARSGCRRARARRS